MFGYPSCYCYNISVLLLITWICLHGFTTTIHARRVRHGFKDRGVCNKTYNGSKEAGGYYSATVLKLPVISRTMIGQPYYCSYVFQGVATQRIMIKISEMSLGQYDNVKQKCVHAYLRLWDGLNEPGYYPYHPNTICGLQSMDIRKVTTESTAMVEYVIAYAREYMTFELQYVFINTDLEYDSYSEQFIHDMRPKKNSVSICDWTINLDNCPSECQIISPGYPGMYPPNTECDYNVISNDSNIMIQINFQGTSINNKVRTFNLRPSDDCTDDYLLIQDNNIKDSRNIAKFCGKETYDIVTTGNNITMKFMTSKQKPPFGYNGFHLSVTGITKEWNPSGKHVKNSLCDWTFTSMQGSISTPDHWLPPRATCKHSFTVLPRHTLVLRFNVYGLSAGCGDTIHIYDEDETVASLCDSNIPHTRQSDRDRNDQLTYRLRGPYSSVVFTTASGQFQGHGHNGYYLSFQQMPDPDEEVDDNYKIINSMLGDNTGSCSNINSKIPLIVAMLLIYSLTSGQNQLLSNIFSLV